MLKHDVCEVVREFFTTGKMFKAINCTAVTLLPKVPNPSTIKEYRPIACCSVLYKLIIAKVLAARIQSVIVSSLCGIRYSSWVYTGKKGG